MENLKKLSFILPRMPWQHDPYSDPPLGFLHVASIARELNPKKLEVVLMDLAHDKISESNYFALGGTTLEYPVIVEIGEKIKKNYPNSKILAGGVHFDVLSEEYWKKEIETLPFDVITRGEGEATIKPALEILENSKEKRVYTQQGDLLDLNSLPLPARDLLSISHYFKSGITFTNTRMSTGEGKSATIMASRGCPFACSFCASPTIYQKKVRFRNFESITKELIQLREIYGVRDLRWQDDNFPLTLKKAKGLEYFLYDYDFRYRASLRTDDQGSGQYTLKQLWHSGCREVGFGLESGEQGVLEINQKGTTIEQNESAIKRAKDQGFLVRAFFMTGLPSETKSSGEITAEFIEKNYLYLDTVTLTNFTPLPGSDVFNNPEKYNIEILNKDWRKYNIAITREFQEFPFVHKLKELSKEEMVRNLEKIKQVVFKRNLSNVNVYNDAFVGKPYKSSYL